MKFVTSKILGAALLASAGLVGNASAQATYDLWNGGSGSAAAIGECAAAVGATYGNSAACMATSGTSNNVSVSAWSLDRGTGGSAALAGSGYANAFLSNQGTNGWGVMNRKEGIGAPSPDHSVDSIAPGLADMVLLTFTSPVLLNQIRTGWNSGDSDLTIMRWAGVSAPSQASGNMTNVLAGANTAGWQLVGNYADVGSGVNRSLSIAGAASSWWLVAAFNTTQGGSAASNNCRGFNASNVASSSNNATCDGGNDGFKLQYISTAAGSTPRDGTGVPEPTSLALVGVALLGVVGGTRRRKAA